MKKPALAMLVLIMAINTGCGTGKNTTQTVTANKIAESAVNLNKSDFEIAKTEYKDKEINISYPQITKMSDSNKQSRINEVIKTEALKVLNDYKEDIDKLNLKMDYEIKYKGSNVLSIQYLGLAMVKKAAYPVHLYNTSNIDLIKGSGLTLKEAATINSSLVKKYKEGKYKPYRADLNLETAQALNRVLDTVSKSDLSQEFQKAQAKFYFSKDSLGISVEVAHAVGDHMEMEISYKALGDLLLITPAD